jgi:hypothetical protein
MHRCMGNSAVQVPEARPVSRSDSGLVFSMSFPAQTPVSLVDVKKRGSRSSFRVRAGAGYVLHLVPTDYLEERYAVAGPKLVEDGLDVAKKAPEEFVGKTSLPTSPLHRRTNRTSRECGPEGADVWCVSFHRYQNTRHLFRGVPV